MTAIVLNLKNRPNKAMIQIPLALARQYTNGVTEEQKDEFWQRLTEMVDALAPVHDRQWLEMICNWTPPDGLSLVQQAPWIRLGMRVADLDTDREGEFHLSEMDVNRIWNRLCSPDFKVRRDAAFDAFIVDFLDAIGKEFPEGEAKKDGG